MTQKTSTLTWLEEWFFVFKYLWGRTCIRWWDNEKIYKVNRSTTLGIFLTKLEIIFFSTLVYLEEDMMNRTHDLQFSNSQYIVIKNNNS